MCTLSGGVGAPNGRLGRLRRRVTAIRARGRTAIRGHRPGAEGEGARLTGEAPRQRCQRPTNSLEQNKNRVKAPPVAGTYPQLRRAYSEASLDS